MLAPAFRALLACPETRRPLELAGDRLVREDGAVAYPVRDGVPALAPEHAIPLTGGPVRDRRDGRADATGFDADRLARLAELERWHFWFVGRRRLVDRLVARDGGGAPQLLLDVGCGTGSVVDLLTGRGHRVVGLDTDVDALRTLRRDRPDAWLVAGDGTRLPFRTDAFDGATVLDVLEHVDDAALLAEVRRVLRPRGWLLVTVPAVPRLWSHADEVAGHLRRYTRAGVARVLAAAGFELRRLTAYQFLLFPLVAATRLLGRGDPGMREREQAPSPRVNAVLGAITAAEVRLADVVSWPIGSSLVAVARRAR